MPLQDRLRAVLFGLVKLGSREVTITVMHKETLYRVEVILQRNIVGREVIDRALRVAGDAAHNFGDGSFIVVLIRAACPFGQSPPKQPMLRLFAGENWNFHLVHPFVTVGGNLRRSGRRRRRLMRRNSRLKWLRLRWRRGV